MSKITTKALATLFLMVACFSCSNSDTTGQKSGGPSNDELGDFAATRTSALTGPASDDDKDGVKNKFDECATPVLLDGPFGVIMPRVGEHGCEEAVMPHVCRGDTAAPRHILGNHALGNFIMGARVRRRTLEGHTVFEIRFPDARDVDIEEKCPWLNSGIVGVFAIRDNYPIWTCRTREVPQQWPNDPRNGSFNRQSRIDDLNPCYFDPAAFGIKESEVQAALQDGGIRMFLNFVAEDGAGNTLRTNLGEGVMDSNTCMLEFTRNAYRELADVSADSCASYCDQPVAIKAPKVFVKGPDVASSTAILPRAEFAVVVLGEIAYDSSCGSPQMGGFLRNLEVAGETELTPDDQVYCTTDINGTKFETTCLVRVRNLFVEHDVQERILGDLNVYLRVGDASTTAPLSFDEAL